MESFRVALNPRSTDENKRIAQMIPPSTLISANLEPSYTEVSTYSPGTKRACNIDAHKVLAGARRCRVQLGLHARSFHARAICRAAHLLSRL
jgi:hypothetical protein